MAIPVVVSSAYDNSSGNVTARTVTLSASAGDLVVAGVVASGRDPQLPADWTDIVGGVIDHDSSSNHRYRLMYRILAAPITGQEFTIDDGGSDDWMAGMCRITGHAASPIDGTPPFTISELSTDPESPTFTTLGANRLILRWFTFDGSGPTADTGYPASHTGLFIQRADGSDKWTGLAHQDQASTGATGAAAWGTFAANRRYMAGTVAIIGAASAAQPMRKRYEGVPYARPHSSPVGVG